MLSWFFANARWFATIRTHMYILYCQRTESIIFLRDWVAVKREAVGFYVDVSRAVLGVPRPKKSPQLGLKGINPFQQEAISQ